MRKILSILLAITIIFSCINVHVFAETGALSVSAPTSAVPGETVNVTVSIPKGTNAVSGSFNLVYDNTMLDVVSCTSGTILSDRNVKVNEKYSDTKIRMSFDGDEPLTKGGIILNVAFLVLPGATGTVKFEVEKFKLYDENYEAIEISDTVSDLMHIVNDADTEVRVLCADGVNTGDNITINVDIKNALHVCGGSFNLVYDAGKFALSSATAGSVLTGYSKQLNKTYAGNKVRLTWAGSSAMSENGTLLTLVFIAKDGVSGDADFTLEKLSVSDINGATIESVAKSASTNVVCTHNVMEWAITQESTCNDKGTESYRCGCGHTTDTREIAATGHIEMGWVITKEATCDNPGMKEYSCKACGYVENSEEIPAHGHGYESVITPPTQAEQGYTTHTCTGCGHSYKDTYTEATGYIISYNVNGGENAPVSQSKKPGESITLSDVIPTRTGYTFLGWATDKNAENAQYYAGNTYSEDADLTLYALWDANEHTITYVVDGETVSVQTYDYDELVNALAEPTKEGYTFSGWSEIPVTMPNKNITVSGTFSINSYIVSFHANGGENAPDEITDVHNSNITIPNVIPTKANAIFLGWSTSQKAKKAEYKTGDTITLTKDYVLYAVWIGIWTGTASEKFSGGNGTKTNPYIIKTAEDLKLIADKVNSGDESYASACYIMVNDIALNDVSNVDNWATEAPANEWTPIGNTTYPFTGTFDGNGYVISGLYINKPKENNDNNKFLGVFGYASDSSLISNATIDKSYIKGFSLIGGIVGQTQGSIKNCNNYSNLYGNYWTSGICGLVKTNGANQSPSVEKCANYGMVTTDEGFASGITTVISVDTPIEVKNCVNYGNIIGNATNGVGYGNGGIVSHINTVQYNVILENCVNYGNVSGAPMMGGISGYNHINSSGQIYYKNCTNYGKVADGKTQISCLGGITGSTTLADNLNTTNVHIFYENCANYGEISATRSSVGGIIGIGYTSQITNCYNAGYINCPDATCDYGGIAGCLGRGSIVSSCYNVGKLYGNSTLGGIVGAMYNETNLIENCINYGEITQSKNATNTGGICGYLLAGSTINTSINVGTITDNNTAKGGVVGYNTGTVKDSVYLSTCGASGTGTALSYVEMQNATNYVNFTNYTTGELFKDKWILGSNPYTSYPMLKNTTNMAAIPISFDLNGGEFPEHTYAARTFALGINVFRSTDALVIYNNSGSKTETNVYGTEVIVDSRNTVVDRAEYGYVNNSTVPNGGFVLSGNGIMSNWLINNVELGDKVYYDATNYEIKIYKKNPKFTFTYGYVTYLPTPHKDGYVFGGWYDENENLITYATKLYATDTLKLHAKWSEPKLVAEASYGTSTYKMFDTATSYESAKKYCESIGGHLATITTADENSYIASVSAPLNKSFIIGGDDCINEGTYNWGTGEPFSYTNWNSGEPNDAAPGEDVVVLRSDGLWNDHKNAYISGVGFICEFDNFKPIGATLYNGHYYQTFDNSVSWEYAKEYCELQGGHLATITSVEEQNAITALISKFNSGTNTTYWLGATDKDTENVWTWITGEEWQYSNWSKTQPDNANGTEHYLQLYTQSNLFGEWNDLPITYSKVGFICEFDSITPTKTTSYKGHIYELYETPTNWTNAQEFCVYKGGYLATVTSEDELNELSGLISGTNKSRYYLGGTDAKTDGTWEWVTGEPWSYSNWSSGQPSNDNGIEDYLQFWNSGITWNDIRDSYYESTGFICEIGTVDNYIPVASEINPANGHIYSVYDMKTSWTEAKQFCENIGGHLVTINDANEQDYVVSLAKDKGSLSSYYIGASDAESEGVWKWVTGEQFWSGNASGSAVDSSYTNWLSDEPNNASSVEHYAHIKDSYSWCWNDTADTSNMGIICEFETTFAPVSEMVYNGHKYYLFDTPMTWTDAKVYSESIGGYLSVITSQEEQDAVYDMVSSGGNKDKYYLGASNLEDVESWKWVNGEAFSYSNWGDGMPHNVGLENENFLMMYKSNGDWNDLKNYFSSTGNTDRGFVVEFDDLNICQITYDANGGENAPEAIEFTKNTDITLSSKVPTRPRYIFKGWSETKDGEVKYQPSQTIRISKSTTLYAVWEEKTYTITYDANGGDYAPETQIKAHGIATCLSEEILYRNDDYYTFLGWSTSSDTSIRVNSCIRRKLPYDAYIQYYPGQVINTDEDLVLFAVWADKDLVPNSIIYYHEEKVIYIQVYNEYAEIISRNYDIDGWATTRYGYVQRYVPGDLYYEKGESSFYSATFGYSDGSVYVPEIYFDANGGEFPSFIQEHKIGEPFILVADIPTRTGYIFVGWATTPDATVAEYMPGGEYVYDDELRLYAIWREEIKGVCGDNVAWDIASGILTITGTDAIYNYKADTAPWYEYRAGITDVVIDNGITSVGDYAFYNLTALKTVSMPETLTDIGEYAFSNCVTLENVDLSHVSKIESYAFRYCVSLTDIVVYSHTSYGTNAYANCSGIKSVVISDGVTELKDGILNNCGTIASLEVPGTVTKISENAFEDCIFTSIKYSGTKDEFAKLLTSENVLDFDTVTCKADDKTYLYSDFFAVNIKITEISFEKKSIGLYVGETAQIVATVAPSNTTEKLVWSSDNETIVTVDNAGNVKAISEGVANITAKSENGNVQAICVVYVNAVADENAPTITIESIDETKNGDTFDVNVSLKNNPGITSMRLALNYDASVMELTNVADLGILGDALHSEDYSSNEYVLYWDNGTSKTNFTENGDAVTLTFKIKDNTKSGDYPLDLSYSTQDIINCELVPVSFDIVNGFVTVKAFTYGDVNRDESVDTIDSAYLSRYIARWSGIIINQDAADVNKDKKINVLDSAILKRHIANWNGYTSLPYISSVKLFGTATNLNGLTPNISVSNTKGQTGKTVDVIISIRDNPGIVNMRLDVDYDKDAMTLTKVTDTGLLPGEVHGNDLTDMPYCLYWDNGASKTDYTVNGDLVTLTFEVKKNIQVGNYPITVSYDYDEPDIINASLESVNININNGVVEVVEVTKPQMALSNIVIGEKTNFALQLLSPDTISGVIIVATYDENTSQLRTVEKYDAIPQKDFSVDTKNGEIVKVMWWDSVNSLSPIADSIIVNKE